MRSAYEGRRYAAVWYIIEVVIELLHVRRSLKPEAARNECEVNCASGNVHGLVSEGPSARILAQGMTDSIA